MACSTVAHYRRGQAGFSAEHIVFFNVLPILIPVFSQLLSNTFVKAFKWDIYPHFGALLSDAGSRMVHAGLVIIHLDRSYRNVTECNCFCRLSEQYKLRR